MPIVDVETFENKLWLSKFQMGARFSLSDNYVVEFLHELSREILKEPRSKAFPDLITIGFFCRKSSIKRYLDSIPELSFRRGVGTVTHISPGNIPVNFAFSLLMGMLSGNSNLIRLPTRNFTQLELFIELFDRICAKPDFQRSADETIFFRSDRDSPMLNQIINKTDGLVVWGGDLTVNHFRSISKSPHCSDIYFPNRVSSSLISSLKVLKCTAKELKNLCLDFYNDTFLVDQNACSSPNHIIWVGSPDQCSRAQKYFWAQMNSLLRDKYKLDPVAKIDRILDVIDLVDFGGTDFELNRNYDEIWRHSDVRLIQKKMRYGMFLESSALKLEDAPLFSRVTDQTLTVFGFDLRKIFHIFSKQNMYFDRIVDIGRALDMGMDWDGKNMVMQLSRKTQV